MRLAIVVPLVLLILLKNRALVLADASRVSQSLVSLVLAVEPILIIIIIVYYIIVRNLARLLSCFQNLRVCSSSIICSNLFGLRSLRTNGSVLGCILLSKLESNSAWIDFATFILELNFHVTNMD